MKKECKIVQDLLPNYIENLTSKETNYYIEQHIKECDECTEVLKNMKKDIEVNSEKSDGRKVKYFKKYRNRMRILKIIILLILCIVIAVLARKVILLDSLSKKAENTIIPTNFHRTSYSLEAGTFSKSDIYSLENKMKIVNTKATEEGVTKTTILATKMENMEWTTNIYIETPTEKTALLNKKMQITVDAESFNPIPKSIVYYTADNEKHTEEQSKIALFFYSIGASITETTYNGEECYYVSNYRNPVAASEAGMYISKNTGLLIATIAYDIEDGVSSNLERWPASENKYQFGTVTQEDFMEPDINEYTVKENI